MKAAIRLVSGLMVVCLCAGVAGASMETIGPPAFAGIFGSRDLTVPNPNDPGNNYTMVHHAGNNADAHNALAYDPLRGWGFEVIYPAGGERPYGNRNEGGQFGPFDDSPNSRNEFSDSLPNELYDSFIGAKNFLVDCDGDGTPPAPIPCPDPEGLIFRVDVPNGLYRFVGVFGEAENPHCQRVLVEDGGSGPPADIGSNYAVLVHNHDQNRYDIGQTKGDRLGAGVFARVGFGSVLPPEPLDEGDLPMFIDMDENGMDTDGGPDSPVLQVTQGYIRLHLLKGNNIISVGSKSSGTSRERNGGDIILFEAHPVPEPATLGLLAIGAFGVLIRRKRR